MANEPLISCLMVTLPVPDRLGRLKQSLAAYLDQTYPRRELVMVIDGRVREPTTGAIKAHVAALGRKDIRIVEPAPGLTLGALRNISRASARGEITCQWDDDDLHHPERLERQLAALVESGGEAVCLQQVMQFFPADGRLYCTTWRGTPERAHPASLMCRSAAPILYPETGEGSQFGEDMAVIRQLQQRGGYHVLANAPHLYVYVSHGANAYDDNHHRRIVAEFSLSQGMLRRREAALRTGLSAFDFGSDGVTVQGSNGPAFVIAPAGAGAGVMEPPFPAAAWAASAPPLSDDASVSCLMVTLPVAERLAGLRRSLAAYLAQTHRRRELVMVIDGRAGDPTTAAIKAHVAALGREDIRVVEPDAGLSLGALRNVSKANARGDVVCLWDDDDLHHPQRLERQLAALAGSGGEGIALQHVMQFFVADRRLYCANWLPTEENAFPASLMCRRAAPIIYPETGEHAERGEDVEVVRQLQRRGGYGVLADAPYLYVYVSHGDNSYGDEHHRALAATLGLSRGLLSRREAALREGLSAFDFGPGDVTVQGVNGPAFVLAAAQAAGGGPSPPTMATLSL